MKSESEVTQSCPTLCDPTDCSLPGFSIHGIFQGKNTGVGCHFLLQRIFPTQGSNLGLPLCRQMLLPSEPPEKYCKLHPFILCTQLHRFIMIFMYLPFKLLKTKITRILLKTIWPCIYLLLESFGFELPSSFLSFQSEGLHLSFLGIDAFELWC